MESSCTNSSGRLKKLLSGLLVALFLILTTVGAVSTTVMATETEPEATKNAGKTAILWKAKYYVALFERCRRVTRDDFGLEADQLLKNGVWENADGYTLRHDNAKLRTDPLLGSGVSYCPDFSFDGKGLFAALVDALADAQPDQTNGNPNNTYTSSGKNEKSWSEMGNRERASLLCQLGFQLLDDNNVPFDKAKQKESDAACAEIMANKVASGTNLWFMDKEFRTPDINDAPGKEITEKLLQIYHLTAYIPIDDASLTSYYTDAEQYYNEYYSYTKRCSKYKPVYQAYPHQEIDGISDSRIKVLEFPEVTSNGIAKRYIINDSVAHNDNVENSLFYGNSDGSKYSSYLIPEKSFSCTKDADTTVWMHAYENLKEQVRNSGLYTDCATKYRKIYQTIKDGPATIDDILATKRKELKEQAIALDIETSHPSNFDICMSGSYEGSTGPGNVYDCTGEREIETYKEQKGYNDKLKAAAVKMNTVNGLFLYDAGEGNCWGKATTDYDKYLCNKDCINNQACNAAVNSNFDVVREAVSQFMEINNPLARLNIIKANIEEEERKADQIKSKIEHAGLVDPSTVYASAVNFVIPGSTNPYDKTPEVIRHILGGIYDLEYSETAASEKRETTVSCNVEDYTKEYVSSLNQYGVEVPEIGDSVLLAGSNMFQNERKNGSIEYGGGYAAPTCEGSALLGWVVCPVINLVAGGADWLYKSAVEENLQMKAGDLEANGQGAHQAWGYFVGFANIILVILFLVVIFSQLTGYGIDNYGIKRILPKLIVVAILINLSFIICQLVVDVSNILGHNLESMLDGIGVQMSDETKKNIAGELIGNMLTAIGLIGAVAGGVYVVRNIGSLVTGLLVPALLALLIALIAVLFFFVLLGIRRAGIIALAVVSPVAIVCYALPNTKKFYTKWYNGFKSLILVYPICGLMLGMSRFVAKLISATNYGFIGNLVALAVLVYPFFVIPTLISKAVSAVTTLGDKVAQAGRGLRRKTRDGVKNTQAYKDAQKRREDAANARRQQNFKRYQEGEGISGRLFGRFGNSMKKYNDKQRALDSQIADAVAQNNTEEADRLREQKAENTRKWLRNGGAATEEEYSKIAAEEGKKQARIGYDSRTQPQVRKDENGNDVIDEKTGQPVYQTSSNAMAEAARIQTANAILSQLRRAYNPPREIDVETSTDRATSAHQKEEQQAYTEQFGTRDKAGLKDAFDEALRRYQNGEGDINEVQAVVSLLQKGGHTKEMLEVLDGLCNNREGQTAWNNLAQDKSAMTEIIGLLGKSGNVVMKGYSKYLAAAGSVPGAKPVDFNTWLNKGDTESANMVNNLEQREGESDEDFAKRKQAVAAKINGLSNLSAFNRTTYGDTHDMLLSVNKDTMEFLNSKIAAGRLGDAIGMGDLAHASVGKTGDELNLINKVLSNSLNTVAVDDGVHNYVIRCEVNPESGAATYTKFETVTDTNGNTSVVQSAGSEAEYVAGFKQSIAKLDYSDENLGKLDISTLRAITDKGGENNRDLNEALSKAFGEQFGDQIVETFNDERILNKMSKDMQKKLYEMLSDEGKLQVPQSRRPQ